MDIKRQNHFDNEFLKSQAASRETNILPFHKQENSFEKEMRSKNVEANFFLKENKIYGSQSIICSRYIFSTYCEAETQVYIPVGPKKVKILTNKTRDKNVGTDQTYVTKCVGPDRSDLNENGLLKCLSGFHGVSSIKSDQEMLVVAGVSFDTYNLFKKIYEEPDGKKIKIIDC